MYLRLALQYSVVGKEKLSDAAVVPKAIAAKQW